MMVIKSHVRGGWSAMRDYLNNEGRFASFVNKNEVVRLVGGQNLASQDLTDMFREMWLCKGRYPVKTPVHHCSINPDPKGRNLTEPEVWQIVERLKEKFGYDKGLHQCLIVEHVHKGRQHWHVIFNRVEMNSRKAIWPGNKQHGHWIRSKLTAREMEKDLGLEIGWSRRGRANTTRLTRPTRHYEKLYAGMLGDIDTPQPSRGKKDDGKDGKGDGSGGGAAAAASALRYISKPTKSGGTSSVEISSGRGNGPERRRTNKWVPIERRSQRPPYRPPPPIMHLPPKA